MRITLNNTLWIVPSLLLVLTGCNQTSQSGTETASGNLAGPAPAAVTEPSTAAPAFVRAVNTVRGAEPVALAINGDQVVENLAFGEVSIFIGLHGDKVKIHSQQPHQITVVDADGKTIGGPLSLDLERGEDITVVIGGAPGKITLTPVEHTNRGPAPDKAKIAVLHADKAMPEISVSVDGDRWPGDIGFGEVTGYQRLAPGQHTMKIMYDKSLFGIVDVDRQPGASPPPPVAVKTTNLVTLTQPLDLEADKVYSVIVYQDAKDLPRLRLIEDKFEPALVRAEDVKTTEE